jgi:hypothetical protein
MNLKNDKKHKHLIFFVQIVVILIFEIQLLSILSKHLTIKNLHKFEFICLLSA